MHHAAAEATVRLTRDTAAADTAIVAFAANTHNCNCRFETGLAAVCQAASGPGDSPQCSMGHDG